MAKQRSARTIAAANGIATDKTYGSVAPPLYLSSTYAFEGFERPRAYDYSRTANPSRAMLADTLAQLERGAGAVVTASGMAAVDLVLSQASPQSLIVAPHDCYAGTYRLLAERMARGHLRVSFVDQGDPAALAAALAQEPALVLIETPSNPLMRIADIRQISAASKAAGAKVAVDNTFLSPALQQPIALGADYVIHSTTKFLNGHSDVVGGAVVAARSEDVAALAYWANVTGVTGAPFDSYLTLRGIRTLFARLEVQQRTAGVLANWLDAHKLVRKAHYPGLASHSGHQLARAQQAGFGAMLSFELDASGPDVKRFLEGLKVITLAESLGGVETLISHAATMTHAVMSAEARERAGIGATLLRLSVGLEEEADLLSDLEQAFALIS
ncbi:MAG TPA: cystathionine gamma-synthase [Hyphomonadaceae bacterium]|nr:cystathionine gamma-synthase [Hyphomonadaceae bacterium]